MILNLILNKYGPILVNKLIIEYIRYPSQEEREYIMDVLFASFIRINEYFLVWLNQAMQLVPEDILTAQEKANLIKQLSKIKVDQLNPRQKSKEEKAENTKVFKQFDKCFDLLDYR